MECDDIVERIDKRWQIKSCLDDRLCPTDDMISYKPKDAELVKTEKRVNHKKGFS
jgi:hypothetical protein